MNPLDLSGPDFLQLYFLLCGAAFFVSLVARRMMRGPGGALEPMLLDLEPYEVAFLAGGEELAVDAALGALFHKGVLGLDDAGRKLVPNHELTTGREHPLERSLMNKLTETKSVPELRVAARPEARPLRSRMERMRLVLSPHREARVRKMPFRLFGLVMLLGVAKLVVGISRDRPVGILCTLLVGTGLGVLLFSAIAKAHRTLLGDRALFELKAQNAALGAAARSRRGALAANDVALAVGLFGVAMLPAELMKVIAPPSIGGDGSSSTSCGSGSSCGGGGGCGGCGG